MATTVRRTAAKLHLLTTKQVQHAPGGDHSDGGGLLLRVRGLSASWVFRYTAPSGKRREMGLGVCHRGSPGQAGDTLTGARDAAYKAREMLRGGTDPIDQRDDAKSRMREADAAKKTAAKRSQLTLARAARDYHARVIEPSKTSKHAAQWISSLENHMPPTLWHQPLAGIEAPELLAALLAVRPHERARNLSQGERVPETVSRVRQRLDAVFEDAIFHRQCTSNPAAAIRRKMREASPRRAKGEFKALAYTEAPALMRRLRQCDGIAAKCLEFGMLTVARTGELIGASWSEFDLGAALWRVPADRMKATEQHDVFLPARAVEILRDMKAMQLNDTIVFPSPMDPGVKLSNGAMLALLGRLGVRDRTTVHGLCRATFSTWANDTGAARPDVVEACLAHEESNKVRASYNRAQFNQERQALLAAWAGYLARPSAQVLPLHAA